MISSIDELDQRDRLRASMQRIYTAIQRVLNNGFADGDRVVVDAGIVLAGRCYGHIHNFPPRRVDREQWVVVTIEGSVADGPVTRPFPAWLRISEVHHVD